MAKSKGDLLEEAQKSGLVPEAATEDDYTAEQLRDLLSPDTPVWEGSASASDPQTAPDGHENLTQEDLDARSS